MNSVTSIATSAILAAERRLETVARNVANSGLPSRSDGEATDTAGPAREAGTDLAAEAVQLTIETYTVAANAGVLRAAAKMQKSVIDILA
jgi:flagellar basal body rod protein FlgC